MGDDHDTGHDVGRTSDVRSRPEPSTVRREMRRFLAIGALTLALVAGLSALAARTIGHDAAEREVEARGETFARAVVAPLVDRALLAGDPRAVAAFERVMRARLDDGLVVHVLVLLRDGTVLWADGEGLVGRRIPLGPDVERLFATADVTGTLAPRADAEDATFDPSAPLLEVYAGAVAVDGTPIVVETYWSADGVAAAGAAVRGRLLPLVLGALVVFAVPVAMLSLSLARRVDRSRRARVDLLRQALEATDLERRRIAADLHDGVLQDVGAARYLMGVLADVAGTDPQLSRTLVAQASGALERVGADLRSTLVDIYPADLAAAGLLAALSDLLRPLAADGVETGLVVDLGADEPVELVQLVYRLVREGLANVHRHAHASRVGVRVVSLPTSVEVDVTDDGRGLPDGPLPEGHFGLRLLADTTRSVGGRLEVLSAPSGGTRLAAALPRDLAAAVARSA